MWGFGCALFSYIGLAIRGKAPAKTDLKKALLATTLAPLGLYVETRNVITEVNAQNAPAPKGAIRIIGTTQ